MKLIDAADRHEFQTSLQKQLYAISDDPFIPPDSICLSLAVGPGPHFAAVVTWQSIELDMEELAPPAVPAFGETILDPAVA